MNKAQFLSILRKKLSSLPQKERSELLEDYEHHYAFGHNAGKTEEEISEELGNPYEIATEALAEYDRNRPASNRSNGSRTIMACIGLFMLNFIACVVPLGLSIWAVWISLFASSILFIFSPLLLCSILFTTVISAAASYSLRLRCQALGS